MILFYVGVAANVAGLTTTERDLLTPTLLAALDEEVTGLTALDYIRANAVRQATWEFTRRFFSATTCS